MPNHHTSCKNCIFAEYDDLTQTGCKLDLINTYRSKDIPVVECYDAEKEFYVIPNRICMSKRPAGWKHASFDLEAQKEQIKAETNIRFLTMVIGNDDETDSIKKTVDSLVGQSLKPRYISVIAPPYAKYSMKDLSIVLQHVPIEWRIERIIDPDLPKCLWEDMVFDSLKQSNFYSVFQAGFEVPQNFCNEVNDKVNCELLQFGALTPNKDNNGWTVPRIVYDYFMGNKEYPLPFKLKELECPTIPVAEVVSNFPQ